jgi:hypothetical protein
MEEGLNESCRHKDDDRCISGTYTHVELTKAVEDLGYKVVKVYEVWHFENWSCGLFSGYISKYFAIKEEVCTLLKMCTFLL